MSSSDQVELKHPIQTIQSRRTELAKGIHFCQTLFTQCAPDNLDYWDRVAQCRASVFFLGLWLTAERWKWTAQGVVWEHTGQTLSFDLDCCFSSSSPHTNCSPSPSPLVSSSPYPTPPSPLGIYPPFLSEILHSPSPPCPVFQVAVSTDSQEALCSDERESIEGLLNLALPPSTCPSSSSSHYHHHLHPAFCLVPETPAIFPKPNSVHTQQHDQHCLPSYSSSASSSSSFHLPPPPLPARSQQQQQEEEEEAAAAAAAASEDQEVSLIICGGLVTSDSIAVENTGSQESQSPFLRQLKRFHSVDTQERSTLLPRPRPYSWLDDPRRHSVEVYSAEDACTQCITASPSSGCVSRSGSLQIPPQAPLPSPRRKKKMSPPCISVDPPDEPEPQSGLYPSLSGMGLGGFGMPPPLPSRDTCLRRRAPSSDSKDSFDLGAGEGSGLDGGSPNPNPSSKLLTLPSFSFEKTNSEHWTSTLPSHTKAYTHKHTDPDEPSLHTHTHTNTWCTLCICDGDSSSNNAVESNNGKTTTNRKTILHEECGTVVVWPSLIFILLLPKQPEKEWPPETTNETVPLLWHLAAWPLNLWTNISTWDLVPPYGHCQNCLVLHRVDTVSGDTKQYERFRDTIFLNYWAIVFVQDVFLFFLSFHILFVSSSTMFCLSFSL